MAGLTRDIAQGFVTAATEVTPNIGHKVTTDTRTTVEKIAGDSASTALKAAGDITCTGMKFVVNSVGTFAKVGSDVAASDASHNLLDTDFTSIRSKVLYDVLETGSRS